MDVITVPWLNTSNDVLSLLLSDINECLENDGSGPCEDECENNIGSYRCRCNRPGYAVDEDNPHACYRKMDQRFPTNIILMIIDVCVGVSLSLSLSLYIYIYIYVSIYLYIWSSLSLPDVCHFIDSYFHICICTKQSVITVKQIIIRTITLYFS